MSALEQNLIFLFRNTPKAQQLWLLATLAELAKLPAELILTTEGEPYH